MLGNPRDDGSGDIVQIVRGVGVANEYDVEPPRDGTAHRCTDAHLGQQTHDGNTPHLIAREDVCKLGTIEAVVSRFAEDGLAWFGRHLWSVSKSCLFSSVFSALSVLAWSDQKIRRLMID